MQIFKDKHFVQTCFSKETKGFFYFQNVFSNFVYPSFVVYIIKNKITLPKQEYSWQARNIETNWKLKTMIFKLDYNKETWCKIEYVFNKCRKQKQFKSI